MTHAEDVVTIAGDGVVLEGRLAIPSGERTGAVVCHPHPQYGGTTDNALVVTVVATLAAAGLATLRLGASGARPSSPALAPT